MSITPAHRSLLRDRLAGVEFRNQQRAAHRRAILNACLERIRAGDTRTSHLNPQPSSIQNKQGGQQP